MYKKPSIYLIMGGFFIGQLSKASIEINILGSCPGFCPGTRSSLGHRSRGGVVCSVLLAVVGVVLGLLHKNAVVVLEASLQPNHDVHPFAEFHDVGRHVDDEDESS